MSNFLNEFFNKGTFAGEIISSCLIILLISITNHHFKNKNTKLIIMIFSFFSSILIGKGLANIVYQGSPVFGILASAIISCFVFNEYHLLWSIIGAQLIGSILGYLIYISYYFVFKKEMVKDVAENKTNSLIKLSYKETLAQIIYIMMLLFIGHITFNNYSTTIDISYFFISMLTLLGIGSLMFLFSKNGVFLISPFISFFTSKALTTVIFEFRKSSTTQVKQELMNIAIQSTISIILTISIGFIFLEIKWW